jgi:hypothetical protein
VTNENHYVFICFCSRMVVQVFCFSSISDRRRSPFGINSSRQRKAKTAGRGAKKEGSVTVYSNTGLESIGPIKTASQKYPFVKIDTTRLQGAKGLIASS